MDIKTLVTLINAGYKITEIKEIPKEKRDKYIDLLNAGIKKDEINDYIELIGDEEKPNEGNQDHDNQDDNSDSDNNDDVDYKKLYEEEKTKRQRLEINKDIDNPEQKTAYDILADFLSDI